MIFKKVVALILLFFLSSFMIVNNITNVSASENINYGIKRNSNIVIEENWKNFTKTAKDLLTLGSGLID